jgi:hypothetical protein
MKISIIINAERKSKLPHEIRKNLSVIYRHFRGTLQALRSMESVQDHNLISSTTLIRTFVFDNYQYFLQYVLVSA